MQTDDPELAALKKNHHPVDIIGLVCGLVPFMLSYSETKSSSVATTSGGGLDVSSSTTTHMDYVAIGGGGLAILFAFVGLLLIGRMRTRAIRFAVFAGLLALGGFQIIRGTLITPSTSSSGTMR